MELGQIEYFVAVAEELSVTRAAERLSIAQSPLSAQIRKLERELGVALFVRTTRSVALTPAGRSFYVKGTGLLAAAHRVVDNVRLAGQGRQGRLSLAFTESATYALMPQLLRAYTERFPEVVLDVRSEMLSAAQVAGLLDGSISVGLLRPPVHAEGLVVEVLLEEPLVALLPVTHPLASRIDVQLDDLRQENFISCRTSPTSSVYQTVMAACRGASFTPKIHHEVAETSSLVALVAAGLGVALAPSSIRHVRIDGVTHRPIRGTDLKLPIAVVYRGGAVPPIVRGYLETARTLTRKQRRASTGYGVHVRGGPARLRCNVTSEDALRPSIEPALGSVKAVRDLPLAGGLNEVGGAAETRRTDRFSAALVVRKTTAPMRGARRPAPVESLLARSAMPLR